MYIGEEEFRVLAQLSGKELPKVTVSKFSSKICTVLPSSVPGRHEIDLAAGLLYRKSRTAWRKK